MKKVQPRTPSGFSEFTPNEQILLEQIKEQIRRSFESFGFIPIETPAVELKDILLAKGLMDNRQIYAVSRLPGEQDLSAALEEATCAIKEGRLEEYLQGLTKGDVSEQTHASPEAMLLEHIRELVKRCQTDMALHFDLTVPLARYVAQNQDSLAFPFRRYQMQKVWRGERPQSGRSREFYQCDIDVIGRGSLDILIDAEIPSIIYRIFSEMMIGAFIICISNAKILEEYLRHAGIRDECLAAAKGAIDDLQKTGIETTVVRLSEMAGISADQSRAIVEFLADDLLSNDQVLEKLRTLNISERFRSGVEELSEVIRGVRVFGVPEKFFRIDLQIARGLDYYTGTVYETVLTDHPGIGSICSGGRYDDLANHYSEEKFPGVGISIGLTRLFGRLLSAGLIRARRATSASVLVTTLNRHYMDQYVRIANDLRVAGISTEMYLNTESIGKQLRYANRKGFQIAIVAGENELMRGAVLVKDLVSGNSTEHPIDAVTESILHVLSSAPERD